MILSCVCLFELFGLGSGDDLVFAQCFLSDSQALVAYTAVNLPSYRHAGCPVLADAAWSILRPWTGHVTGGEAQVEVSSENHGAVKMVSSEKMLLTLTCGRFSLFRRNQVVEMFDHAYQNYMVSY